MGSSSCPLLSCAKEAGKLSKPFQAPSTQTVTEGLSETLLSHTVPEALLGHSAPHWKFDSGFHFGHVN